MSLKQGRVISSVGSEHLVYTEGVGGSNPSSPTFKLLHICRSFFFVTYKYSPVCHLYILYSASIDRYYIGVSIKLARRLGRQKGGSSKATKIGVPWVLVHTELYRTKSEAMKRASYLKRQKSRKLIEKIIQASS